MSKTTRGAGGREPVAIVGMGCRFAGAPDLQSYWAMTVEGRDAFGPVPSDRWDHAAFFDENKRAIDKSYAPTGAFIADIKSFPGLALGIPPRRIEVMDPQQRFSLEVALQAIHDAGYDPADMPRKTGVFMGVTASEYRTLMSARIVAQFLASGRLGRPPEHPDEIAAAVERVVPSRPYTAPGALANMIAATVAQELDLRGPAYTLDAACASAMVAIHDAVIQLRSGVIDAAVAGGVYLCVTPEHHVAFSRIGAISASGRCLPFDARADGFVQGDGAGAVILKRLSDAERDGDRIYALIRGVAMNNDGRGDGPMAPVEAGQSDVIGEAWRDARIEPDKLGYIETHGTGTDVGDATEFHGLQESLGGRVGARAWGKVALGSSKANVGHTMAAAGIAGVIRAALAIHHRTLPPMAGFESARPELGLEASAFRILARSEPWSQPTRVAGVSSFGFGGTNGHVVLSESEASYGSPVDEPHLVQLSAPTEAELRGLARRTARSLKTEAEATVAGVSRAWAVRPPQKWRLAVVAATTGELAETLAAVGEGATPKGCWLGEAAAEAPKVAFLFPGQGAQRIGMLRSARARFPLLSASIEESEAHLSDVLRRPLSALLWPELRREPVSDEVASAELRATENCQPALAAVGIALWRLLETAGVKPTVTAGHSLGEFVAAVAGGALTPKEALRFTASRGRLMADRPGDPGAMAAIMADRATTSGLLVEGAVLANHNHPAQCVVSGETDAVAAVVARAEERGIKARKLDVSHAFHSPLFADLDVEALLADVDVKAPSIPVASATAAHPWATADDARDVMRRHAGNPVDFVGALEQCREAGAELYVQVGVGGPLASFARGVVDKSAVMSLGSMADDDDGRSILEGLGWLWSKGVPVDVRGLGAPARVVSVPPVILPREVYWAVKEEKQLALKIVRSEPAPRAVSAPTPVAEVAPAPEGDDVLARVIEVVARVSSYPKTSVQPRQALVDDLGFDSLMVADLATGLADAFPGLGGLPQELLVNRPTVGAIADHVRTARTGGATPADDDAPLLSYRPVWRPTPLPEAAEAQPERRSVKVAGHGSWASSLRSGLGTNAAGVPDLLVWVCDAADPAPVHAVLAGEIALPDPAAAFLAEIDAIAATGSTCDVLVVRRTDDPWAEAVAGAARSIAREWPDRTVKSLAFDARAPVDRLVAAAKAELASSDRSVDVRWTTHPDARFTAGFEKVAPTSAWTPGAGDTVLVTGGTRGIGAALGGRLAAAGARLLLVGRSEPDARAKALIDAGKAVHLRVDASDRDALVAAVLPHRPVTAVVHAAGVLADGPLGSVDASIGAAARKIKVGGWLAALAAAPGCKVALGIGSWAGRFGSRHQAHYAAANAAMAALTAHPPAGTRAVVAELGPWSSSAMVGTIPAAVQAAMRSEGVDFASDAAGLDALWSDLTGGQGISVRGRDLPWTTRVRRVVETLSTETHPYLSDHAIEGTPIFPLAAAADLIAQTAGLPEPFELARLELFTGIAVREPVRVECVVSGERAEIRFGERRQLAYRARVRPLREIDVPPPVSGGDPSPLSLAEFYGGVTFHGPLLQGLASVDGLGEGFARGTVTPGQPKRWIPGTARATWAVDPLALDSAMQLSAVVAWIREKRGGTPIGIGRLAVLAPLGTAPLTAEVRYDPATAGRGDRFTGTLILRDPSGKAVLVAEDTAAELKKRDVGFEPKREWVDPSTWQAVKDLEIRLEMAKAVGLRNPYFAVHQGTARNTTVIDGRELVNFSSYNYVGLSGDPRVLKAVHEAVDRYGTSVSASRVASGERPFHGELEAELAAAQGAEDALVFTAGHATNVTTIGHLFGKGDLVLHDELIHDSALQGIKLSGAGRRGFRHDDPDHLEQILREMRPNHEKCLIVVEGVYSMDGDICHLPRYVELKKKWGCMLMVDEAHSFGVIGRTGRGIGEHTGVSGREIDIWMGTLSKSLASCGGWIAGSKPLVTYLRYTAPGFVYSAGLTPANGVAALTSLRLMLEEPWRVEKLQANARRFWDGLNRLGVNTGPARGGSAVVPAVTGNSLHALVLSQRLAEQNVNVQPIVYPAVADDSARLRFFLSSTHTDPELDSTAEKVASTLEKIRQEFPIPK